MVGTRSHNDGFTIPEVLVSSFIVLVMGAALLIVVSQLKTQAHASEAVVTARYDLQLLFRSLTDAFEESTAEGLHISSDSQRFSLQRIDGLSLNGTRAWSPFVTFYFYDAQNNQILSGQVELSEIGIEHQPALPATLTDDNLLSMFALRRADGKLKSVGSHIDGFYIERPNALTAKVHLVSVLRSGKYKDEKVEDSRTFFFASAADL